MRDPKAYVLATIAAWRSALKRRDIFVTPGIRYGDPRRGLLDGAAWQDSSAMVCHALNRSPDAEAEVTGLTRLLDETYARVAARASDNSDLRIEIVDGKSEIVVTPLDKLEEPESLRALASQRPGPHAQGRLARCVA